MNQFDIKTKYSYHYVRGMEIAYLDGNHEAQTGTIRRHDCYSIELMSGEVLNKGRVYDILSKVVVEECQQNSQN